MLARLRVTLGLREAVVGLAIRHYYQIRACENANKNANEDGGCEFRGSTGHTHLRLRYATRRSTPIPDKDQGRNGPQFRKGLGLFQARIHPFEAGEFA
jgi:hypothetical protein